VPPFREVELKQKIYLTNRIPQEAMNILLKQAKVEMWKEEGAAPYHLLLEAVREVQGILCLVSDRIDAQLIDSAPNLKVISTYAVGFDNIAISRATQRGIAVGNTPGVLSETTADLAFGLLMAAARHIAEGDRYVREGNWRMPCAPMLMLGRDIYDSTLGIVGMGRIGAEMARRAKGFNMRVLYYNRRRREDLEKELGVEYLPLKDLLVQSDFISLHVPLNEYTQGLIGAAELALMKPTAILINTARGAVVDQKALFEALKSGRLAGAGLDVVEIEPIPGDDPLLTLNNVVFTPHIGSASVATRTKMAVMAVRNLIAGLKGERLPNCVNPEIYDKKP
jgi:glyoxylate reductase